MVWGFVARYDRIYRGVFRIEANASTLISSPGGSVPARRRATTRAQDAGGAVLMEWARVPGRHDNQGKEAWAPAPRGYFLRGGTGGRSPDASRWAPPGYPGRRG